MIEQLPGTKELRDALIALEDAAWSRKWSDLKIARARIKATTGCDISHRLRRELEVGRGAQGEQG